MTDQSRSPRPGPMLRRGPRPLVLHLTLAMLRSSASLAASPSLNVAWAQATHRWATELRPRAARPDAAAETARILEALGDRAGEFSDAVLGEALRQDADLIAGIAAYRRHPSRRDLEDPAAVWEEGNSRLLDYGGAGPTVLFVPSLVNRGYVLDLAPGRSMVRFLAARGMRVLLLDWGWPGALERGFTLTDYVAGRLERVIAAACALVGERVVLAGYCMGGMLTAAAVQRRPELVRALALLATPWDFHGEGPARPQQIARMLPLLEPIMKLTGTLTVDALQVLFALLDPFGVSEKYRGFARLDQASERAGLFVALEDWLNDGVPLAAPVARECLGGWYGANTPAAGAWHIAGLPVEPRGLDLPSFVAVPARDRIVPPDSARPLAELIPGARLHEPAAGHVGMVAGSTAQAVLWEPLQAWIEALAAPV